MTRAKTYFTDKDPENIDILEVTDLIVTGITSVGSLTPSSIGIGTTSPQYALDVYGDINFTSTLRQNGVPINLTQVSYASTAGISTVARGLTGTPNITVGIVTAAAYVSSGTTAVYAGINTSTIDSNTTSVHYIAFDTNASAVNISNFTPGKKLEIVARNIGGGGRTLIIRTSTSTSGHTIVSPIIHSGGTITNGTISIAQNTGLLITIYNVNGTVVGAY